MNIELRRENIKLKESGLKKCIKCGEIQLSSEFYTTQNHCKKCNKKYSSEHKTQRRESSLKRENKNRENINKRKREYYKINILEMRIKHNKYYHSHKLIIKKANDKYKKKNARKIAEYKKNLI